MKDQRLRSGKCDKCREFYEWKGKPLLSEAYCIHCRSVLRKMTVNTVPARGWTPILERPYVSDDSSVSAQSVVQEIQTFREEMAQP